MLVQKVVFHTGLFGKRRWESAEGLASNLYPDGTPKSKTETVIEERMEYGRMILLVCTKTCAKHRSDVSCFFFKTWNINLTRFHYGSRNSIRKGVIKNRKQSPITITLIVNRCLSLIPMRPRRFRIWFTSLVSRELCTMGMWTSRSVVVRKTGEKGDNKQRETTSGGERAIAKSKCT